MARGDIEKLLNAILPAAQYLLRKNREMYPIGAFLDSNDKVVFAEPHMGGDHPPSQQVIDDLVRGFREQAARHEIKATAICFDGRVVPPGQTDKVDALCGEFEHSDGESITIYYPYTKGWFKKQMYGKAFACAGESRIFVPGGKA